MCCYSRVDQMKRRNGFTHKTRERRHHGSLLFSKVGTWIFIGMADTIMSQVQ